MIIVSIIIIIIITTIIITVMILTASSFIIILFFFCLSLITHHLEGLSSGGEVHLVREKPAGQITVDYYP